MPVPFKNSPIYGVILYALAVASYAIMEACAKALGGQYPVAETVAFRSVFGYLPILFLMRSGGEPMSGGRFRSQAPFKQVVRGVLIAIASGTFFLSLSGLSLADATALSLIAPLLMAGLGVFVLAEKADRTLFFAMIVAAGGVLLIVQPGSGEINAYALLALCAAVAHALAAVMTKIVASSDGVVVTAIWGNSIMLLLAVTGMIVGGAVWPVDGDWLVLGGLGMAGGVGNVLYIKGLRLCGVSDVSILDYTIFAWAVLFGATVFSETPSVSALAGAALIVGSGVIFVFRRTRQFDTTGQPSPAPFSESLNTTASRTSTVGRPASTCLNDD